jgi:Meiotically up-regulated gene 113
LNNPNILIFVGIIIGAFVRGFLTRSVKKVGKKYIYVMFSSGYLFRYKIGISNNVDNRRKNIDDSLRGSVTPIFALSFFYAYEIEQMMHLIYKPLSAKMKGSGKTEWFWMIFPFTPVILLCAIWVIQQVFAVAVLSLILIYFFA